MHSSKSSASCSRFLRSSWLAAGLILVFCSASWAQLPTAATGEKAPAAEKKWSVSFGGYAMSGRVTTALLPVSGNDYADMNPIERPFGFSLAIDYKVGSSMRLFFDGGVSNYRKQVGIKDEYSTSFWVYEMTDYTSHIIGPFTDDAFFYMDTTGMRLGFKYDFQANGFRPWAGLGLGIYSWKADYATPDRGSSWGSDSGMATGATFLLGVDFFLGESTMLTVFGDFASPVANPLVSNLFQDGWTWENSGGSHVMGPYRFGVSLGFRN